MVVYFGMTLLIKAVVLTDMEGGFVYLPQDETAQLLLYVFAGVAVLSLVLQFVVPGRIRSMNPAVNLDPDMVRYALCESIAILGLLLFLLSGQMVESWVFIGVALLTLLFGDRQATKAL